MSTRPLRAILFDLDNTLIDRDAAFVSWLDGLAVAGSAEQSLSGESFADARGEILERDAHGQGDRRAFCSWLHSRWPWLGDDADAVFARMTDGIRGHLTPDRCVSAMLAELGRDHRLALVSNGGSFNQRGKLARTDLGRCFDAVVISGEVSCAKPDATIFELALQRLGVTPQEAIFVGDQPLIDIAAAAAAGMATCWLRRGEWPEGLPRADGEVDRIVALPGWLAKRSMGVGVLA